MNPEKKSDISYYTRTLDGHRRSYLDFVKKKIGGNRVKGITLILRKHPLLFLMVEDNFLLYFIVSCIRALFGWRTAGLLFRPKPALDASNFRLKLKLIMLKFLKKVENVHTLSIVPTTLDPEIATIVDGWIYDFQLWDINQEQRDIFNKIKNEDIEFDNFKEYEISNKVKKYAQDKKILVALGAQNKGKGIHILTKYINKFVTENYVVVIAGRFDGASSCYKSDLKDNGALIFDRFMTDEEILSLYAVADAVWCYYDPSYDQASGILGRSIQLGILPIVRPNSFSEKFCQNEKILYISPDVSKGENLNISQRIEEYKSKEIEKSMVDMEKVSRQRLSLALGLDRIKNLD